MMAATADVEEFIGQNRHLADFVETFRAVSESDKHWKSRREFIFRNINDYEDPHVDHLLALSMVWTNHVFLGCRYNSVLLEKVNVMADGIVVEDAPVFKTRDELMKQQKVMYTGVCCLSSIIKLYKGAIMEKRDPGYLTRSVIIPAFNAMFVSH